MGKGFQFIDGTKTDKATRRRARSHAMKGKNLGKTHYRGGSRPDRDQRQECGKPSPPLDSCDREVSEITRCPQYRTPDSAGQLLIYQSLSIPLLVDTAPQSLDIVKNYFTFVVDAVYFPRLCLSLDHIKSYWLRMMFVDKTSYHCSLALMATLNGFVFSADAASPEAIYHLGKAVALVNKKLGSAEALSNSSISVVNFLVVREMHRDGPSADIHWNGLLKMIELRGGLSQLEDLTLILKTCKTDIDHALRYGTLTSFYRDHMSQAVQVMGLDRLSIDTSSLYYEPTSQGISPFLKQILLDTNQVANWFNQSDQRHKAHPDALQEIIVSLGYRLTRFRALQGPPPDVGLEGVYHIGLVAFLTTLFLQVNGRCFLKYGLVSGCLRTVIEQGLSHESNEVMLWLLFIGGISVVEEEHQLWLVLRISNVARSLGIHGWAQVHQVLVQFPWISRIHDEPGEILWEKVKMSIP